MVRSAVDYLDARLPFLDQARDYVRKIFPDHWSFLLGEMALYSFVLLLLTGVWLTFFFEPGMGDTVYHGAYTPLSGIRMSEAYSSVLRISFDVRGGLLIRQIHHWAAVLFLSAIGLHLLRIFFTGAFRKPREVNWLIGLTMFVVSLLEGFAGYSLPDDLLSGTGLRTAEGITLSIPIVGTYLQMFFFGGEFPGTHIVGRLFSLHVLLLPGVLLALVGLHLMLVFTLGHTQWHGHGRTNRNVVGMPLFPQFAARSTGLAFCTFGVCALAAALAQINPVWVYGPYRPDQASTDAQPDWYVGFLEGAMRLMPGVESRFLGHTVVWDVFIPAVVLPAVLFGVLYLYPFAERLLTRDKRTHHLCDRPRHAPVRTGLGVAGVVFYGVLLLAGSQDLLANVFQTSVELVNWTLRIAVLVLPFLAFALTRRLCLGLQERDMERVHEGVETGWVRQNVSGGYEEEHRPLERD
ncbi:cytochrome b [Streptacidiphilus monticola]|uniref:Cytochrome bc1 complex cytochrome b subunit n=1 Tax=Streptacidiphilus monticola TaxID=2161674 RepID=A0ABW1G781_9ACTN